MNGGMGEELKPGVLKTNKPANLPHLFVGSRMTDYDAVSCKLTVWL